MPRVRASKNQPARLVTHKPPYHRSVHQSNFERRKEQRERGRAGRPAVPKIEPNCSCPVNRFVCHVPRTGPIRGPSFKENKIWSWLYHGWAVWRLKKGHGKCQSSCSRYCSRERTGNNWSLVTKELPPPQDQRALHPLFVQAIDPFLVLAIYYYKE